MLGGFKYDKLPEYKITKFCFWLETSVVYVCHLTRHSVPLTISDISLSIKHLVVFPQTANGSRP